MNFNKVLRAIALNFGRHDVGKFASEISYKDFCLWQLHLYDNGGLTLENRIYTAMEPRLADFLVTMYAKVGVKASRADFLSGFNLNPVGYDAIEAKNNKIIAEIKRRRHEVYARALYYEKADPKKAAHMYEHMPQWSKEIYNELKRTNDWSIVDSIPINL